MPKIKYIERKFSASSLEAIDRANEIVAAYQAQGLDLTLRQVYYQFVTRNWLVNSERSYKRLGSILNDARLAGLIDWERITDRTRNLRNNSHWSTPGGIISSAAHSYATDKWKDQPSRVEVWIEKDALVGVFEGVCKELDLPHFSCRGYTSQSEVWAAGRRMRGYRLSGQQPIVLHFGDHDPSGIDMTRDIRDRLVMFAEGDVEVVRVALNMDQVEQYGPPPNPAKATDARYKGYQDVHGNESWELDALEPTVLIQLVRDNVAARRDETKWEESVAKEDKGRDQLQVAADNWPAVAEFIDNYEPE